MLLAPHNTCYLVNIQLFYTIIDLFSKMLCIVTKKFFLLHFVKILLCKMLICCLPNKLPRSYTVILYYYCFVFKDVVYSYKKVLPALYVKRLLCKMLICCLPHTTCYLIPIQLFYIIIHLFSKMLRIVTK